MTRTELNKFVMQYVTRQIIAGDYEVSGFRLLLDCPLPECQSARKSRHFYVNREWYGWRCYRQGEHGSLKELVLENPRVWSAVRRLDDRGQSRGLSAASLDLSDLVPLVEDHPSVWPSLRAAAYKYALSRKVTPAQVNDYKLSAKPLDPRLWFPFWDKAGRCVYRMGRWIDSFPDTGAVKTYEEGTPDKPLFGSHVRKPEGYAVLVEGVFDHFVTPHSFAIMGSHLTGTQIVTLEEWVREKRIDRVFWLYDPDAKEKARREVLYARKKGIPATACFLEGTDSDPGALGVATMGRVVKALSAFSLASLRARPFLTVLLRQLAYG